MTHDRAAEIKMEMFQSIDESTHIDPDTSLWYMAYLYDQGHDFPEIKRLQGEINTLMKEQLASLGSSDDAAAVPEAEPAVPSAAPPAFAAECARPNEPGPEVAGGPL